MTSIFFCRGSSDLDKISQTGTECRLQWCVEMETRCRIPIWRTFGRIQWHVMPEPRITLQGAATWWIHCHNSRATYHIAGCKNSMRHIENCFRHIYFCGFVRFFVNDFSTTRGPIHAKFCMRTYSGSECVFCPFGGWRPPAGGKRGKWDFCYYGRQWGISAFWRFLSDISATLAWIHTKYYLCRDNVCLVYFSQRCQM